MSVTTEDFIALQSRGVRIDDQECVRRGGAGPADARSFLFDGHPVMVPTLSRCAETSEYSFVQEGDAWRLEKHGQPIGKAKAVPCPRFYKGKTKDGVEYRKIALLHGEDCLASTVIQECVRYNSLKTRCRFCAIGASLESGNTIHTKTPEQLAEVARAAMDLDGVRHVTLTAGTTPNPDTGALYLGRCTRAIKEATGLPVEIQFEPLRDEATYAKLKAMGVDDVGLHVESFDPAVRKAMTPGKAAVDLDKYFDAFEKAVAVFGRNKVSTYVILGLGEDEELTLEGCRRAAELGVYTIVVPLRPLLESCLADSKPVDPAYLDRMYSKVGKILAEHGLSIRGSSAGCVRCRACSLLQFTEKGQPEPVEAAPKEAPAPHIQFSVAATPEEVRQSLAIRHEVFVAEQGVFQGSDEDAHDAEAIHILAKVDGQLAGCVRCYHHSGGVWYGGRLAVLPAFRTQDNIGALLIREAVRTMESRPEVKRFLATVQWRNVRFFQRLGWDKLGKSFLMHGLKHQVMNKRLDRESAR